MEEYGEATLCRPIIDRSENILIISHLWMQHPELRAARFWLRSSDIFGILRNLSESVTHLELDAKGFATVPDKTIIFARN
jgi:hypothetical protein